ncbi:MAG: hypothetical protein HYS17_10120 [Micavibrio aeruginosavorus]|uniref:Glutamine amidotransferase domain-containing protein n=1 Tax=Micavibrio aeruginosavorus TaxID=349221 RepID=A0A7T5R1J1_9BACT|nr:MAG: hypothetical protein HYS17_10120 [Micavibrio aeruginosavorus]
MNSATLTIHFAPLIPQNVLWLAALLSCSLLLMSIALFRTGIITRSLCAAGFLLVLLNPSLAEEQREPVSDVTAIVVDRSPSQKTGDRMQRTDKALSYLREKLEGHDGLDVRIIEAPIQEPDTARETRLFEAVDHAFADVPAARRAGVILITDGQVHDAPANPSLFKDYGPIHTLLTGRKNERDRQMVVVEAPAYGIVGQEVTVRYRVEDPSAHDDEFSTVSIRQDNSPGKIDLVPINEDHTLQIKVNHAGQNVVYIEASGTDGELTLANNKVPLIINGVRDRLKVLLVSGEPHAGGRTWRNLLTSDPGVDLVHFTILREPDKLDLTPHNELSLIAFPFRELFEIKLYDFDLIIFDRYGLNRILPTYYFGNIAEYVKKGGALLEASGPSFAGDESIYTTALQDILPAQPTGVVYNHSFLPTITEIGQRHPVTQDLKWKDTAESGHGWGSWLRQIGIQPKTGQTVMSGFNNQPLLVLNRVGDGRIAQLASDQIWLWSRGYEGGGPQTELLRRLAHWLMKEPELEENALVVELDGNSMFIKRRSLHDAPLDITMTSPDGKQETVKLTPQDSGFLEARIEATQLGIYTFDDGMQERFALVGDINPPEMKGVRTTDEILQPIAKLSGGSVNWLVDQATPDIRFLENGKNFGGHGWLGLKISNNYQVTGVTDTPLLPNWVYVLLLIGLIAASWWVEGRRN